MILAMDLPIADVTLQAANGDPYAFVFLALDGPQWAQELGFDGRTVRAWLLGELSVPPRRFWA